MQKLFSGRIPLVARIPALLGTVRSDKETAGPVHRWADNRAHKIMAPDIAEKGFGLAVDLVKPIPTFDNDRVVLDVSHYASSRTMNPKPENKATRIARLAMPQNSRILNRQLADGAPQRSVSRILGAVILNLAPRLAQDGRLAIPVEFLAAVPEPLLEARSARCWI